MIMIKMHLLHPSRWRPRHSPQSRRLSHQRRRNRRYWHQHRWQRFEKGEEFKLKTFLKIFILIWKNYKKITKKNPSKIAKKKCQKPKTRKKIANNIITTYYHHAFSGRRTERPGGSSRRPNNWRRRNRRELHGQEVRMRVVQRMRERTQEELNDKPKKDPKWYP